MCRFIIIPSVVFNRRIFPKCFGISEAAFRLYILECAFINRKSGLHYSGPNAARKYIGLDEDEYALAQKELVKHNFIFRHYVSNEECKLKYWGVHNPPLNYNFQDINDCQYIIPKSEPQSGNWAKFHNKSIPYSFIRLPSRYIIEKNELPATKRLLANMSVDEIYCYINILWQNRECWVGVDPNYVRYNLSLDRFQQADFELTDFMSPKVEWGDKLYVDPVFIERTHISIYALESILYSLVERYKLFQWAIWIACPVTYYERRRSINSTSLKLVYLLDFNRNNVSSADILVKAKEVCEADESKILIATLQSCHDLNSDFKNIIEYNCSRRGISNFIKQDQSR